MQEALKYKLLFFFDYGAGGCLWANNDLARKDFGYGPIDFVIAQQTGKITADTLQLIDELDIRHADYLNKVYPPDPSLWRQNDCDAFNRKVDALLQKLLQQLADDFDIIDQQPRYTEDAELDEYLKDPSNFKRNK